MSFVSPSSGREAMKTAFRQIHHLSEAQAQELCDLFQNEFWSRGRTLPDVQEMLKNPGVIVAFEETATGRLAAFARVITDYVYKGLLLDVIVAPDFRGHQLGRALLDAVVSHPALARVGHIELYCLPELVPFYQKWGFTGELGALRFMRRTAPAR